MPSFALMLALAVAGFAAGNVVGLRFEVEDINSRLTALEALSTPVAKTTDRLPSTCQEAGE